MLTGFAATPPRLDISKTETEWKQHPVFHLDFNVGDYTSKESFRSSLGVKLTGYERIYGVRDEKAASLSRSA